MDTPGSPTDSLTASALDVDRCAVCGWPLVAQGEFGCWRGNCSQRPLPARFYDPARVEHEYGPHAPKEADPYDPSKDWHKRAMEAERTVASLAAMLGWGNVPPRDTLERDIAALKARAARVDPSPPTENKED